MKLIKKPLTNGQYRGEKHPKTMVFLHHTAGSTAQSAWAWWNHTPERIGTAFLIERDGTVIQAFDPATWAYHLNLKQTHALDQKSIGIELVSWGPLKKIGEKFYAYPSKFQTVEVPNKDIVEFKEPYKGYKFHQGYTKEQLVALNELLGQLKKDFPTLVYPKSLPKDFHKFNPKIISEQRPGIWSHSSVNDQKYDIVPQPELISSINSFLNT